MSLKIITWNCNGAFRKKFEHLASFDADILLIQECENPLESKDDKYIAWASNYLWFGDTKNKGIGIFAKPAFKLDKLNWSTEYNGH
jgi:exonuclease III